MRELASDVERWRAADERFALATVVAARRTAPRPVGSKLGVSASGELAGSVSGGCVEGDVYAAAREVLAGGPPVLRTYGIADETAFEVGLPCGGEIDVFVEEPRERVVARLLEALARDEHVVRLVVVDGPDAGADLLVLPDGTASGEAPAELAAEAPDVRRGGRPRLLESAGRTVFADVVGPPPRLLVFGAVDTAEALCRAAKGLGWRTVVVDARARLATPERVPSADELVVAWPDEALARLAVDASTAVAVLTHDDRFDVPALAGVLGTEAFYVGALGSRRTQERRRERLLDAGVTEEQLERVSGPCGLDLGASTPAETAVSILSEILAVRAGRAGGRLKESRGRIHADVA